MTTPAISTKHLGKVYSLGLFGRKRLRALDDLSLDVGAGELVGLLGPNGAGKSTTIKVLLNLIRPTSGQAFLFGKDVAHAEARRLVGYLPENPAPYEYLTGAELVILAGKLCGLSGNRLASKVDEVISRVGMSDARHLQIRRYSKGMVQRIVLAQALVNDPQLLILDEPTSGLDVLGRQLMRDVIREQRARGTAVLLCSHIIPDVEELCDRVAVLIGGKMVREGSVAKLLADDAALTEVTVEGVPQQTMDSLRPSLRGSEPQGERVVLRCEEREVRNVLQAIVSGPGRVLQVQRTKYTLEELFVRMLEESQRKVGSTIS